MSRLWYGADNTAFTIAGKLGIELQICRVVEFTTEPVWDGPTYTMSRVRLHAHCIFNPEATSWLPGGLFAGGDPTAQPQPTVPGQRPSQGAPPAWTHVAVRHFLMQPRRQLLYVVENTVVLCSPEILFVPNVGGGPATKVVPCDANNGPFPLHCNVTAVKGTKTFLVDFAIETFINECAYYKSPSLLSVIASHRWSMHDEIDEDLYTTRTIRGHAIFKSDLLNVVQRDPDAYRAFLFHPVSDNFHRDSVAVAVNEDNNRLDYTLTDREVPINLTQTAVGQKVTRIDAWFTKGMGQQSAFDAWNGIPGVNRVNPGPLWNIGQRIFNAMPDRLGPIMINKKMMAQDIGAGADWAAGPWRLPRQEASIQVRVWGQRDSTRADLYFVAMQILLTKLGQDNILSGTSNVSVTEDLMGKYVEVSANYRSAPDSSLFVVSGVVAKKGFAKLVPGNDAISPITTTQVSLQPLPVAGRGTYLEVLTARALTSPCEEETVAATPSTAELRTTPLPGVPDQLPIDITSLGKMTPFFPTQQTTLSGGNGLP